MAATAAPSVIAAVQRTAPPISDEVRAQLAAERRRLQADPAARRYPADLSFPEKHVFRTEPGTWRRVRHNLPLPPEEATYGEEKAYRFAKRRWDATVAQPWFPGLPRDKAAEKLAAYLETVRDALGDAVIQFTPVPRHQECYFVTDSDVVAGYVETLMARGKGEFARVYKEQKARLVVGTEAFPNTDAGARLARAYAAQHGIEEIKLVKE